MSRLLFLIVFGFNISFAQTIDYNTKKGIAIDGYDVVAYFKNEAIEGKDQFTSKFDNVIYKFSSEKNRKAFELNPKKYIPQYGGYCAYAIALKSDKVSIDPETYLIKDGKLYLFYNSWGINTLKSWKAKNQEKLQQEADKNWDNIKFNK